MNKKNLIPETVTGCNLINEEFPLGATLKCIAILTVATVPALKMARSYGSTEVTTIVETNEELLEEDMKYIRAVMVKINALGLDFQVNVAKIKEKEVSIKYVFKEEFIKELNDKKES